jgi:putative hydrolase of the HAD superfamily
MSPDQTPDLGPDLRHVRTWLFDLDNTLYPADSGLMGAIVSRMTDYVMQVTGLPRDEAHALQKAYLAQHGLTLVGLMQNHGVDPDEFHTIFHDITLEALAHDADLTAAIGALPGRRAVFTNADAVHTARVLEKLGLDALFPEIFHIGTFGYVPKPQPEPFGRLIAEHDVEPKSACFFEDSERNLAPAHALGMTTVLVGPHAQASEAPFVTYRVPHLAPFLRQARLAQP